MDFKTFKSAGTITIQEVLTRIKNNPENVHFSIGFCRAIEKLKGEPKGGIVWYDKAVYGAKNRTQNNDLKTPHTPLVLRNFKLEGTIPIINYETDEFKTPLIASIMFFEGKIVKHAGKE